MPDHVHVCIAIPPEYAVASVIGFLKGRVRLRSQGSDAARSGISQGNIFGLGDMRYRLLGLN
jgi:putative transposase